MPRLIVWIAIVAAVIIAAWLWLGSHRTSNDSGSQPAPHAIDQNG